MKYFLVTLFSLLVLAGCSSEEKKQTPQIPRLESRVNDYAGMLSPVTKQKLEVLLASIEQRDSSQVVVLTIPSLEGQSLESYTMSVCEAWKLGQKGKDNGVLIFASKSDRKLRIEVGRGLEGKLTDLTSGHIVRQIMVPAFKKEDYDAGFLNGASAISKAVSGEYKPSTGDLIQGVTSGGKNEIAATAKSFASKHAVSTVVYLIAVFLGSLAGFWTCLLAGGIAGLGIAFIVAGLPMLFTTLAGVVVAGVAYAALSGIGFPVGGVFSSGGGFSGGGGDFGGGGFSGDW